MQTIRPLQAHKVVPTGTHHKHGYSQLHTVQQKTVTCGKGERVRNLFYTFGRGGTLFSGHPPAPPPRSHGEGKSVRAAICFFSARRLPRRKRG